MRSRKRLHRLVDELPENDLAQAERVLEALARTPCPETVNALPPELLAAFAEVSRDETHLRELERIRDAWLEGDIETAARYAFVLIGELRRDLTTTREAS